METFKLIAGLIFFLSAGLCYGESGDTTISEEIIVVGKRSADLYIDKSRNVEIINREDIQSAPVISAESLLEYSPGIDVRQRGVFGMQSDICLRGGGFNQTMILINGIPVNDPQTGHHNLNIPVDIENISQIEILKGPGSRILGPNAFGGAVNIITGSPGKNNLMLNLSGGENEFYKTGIAGNISSGPLSNYISLFKNGSGPYIENTDYQSTNLFYQGGLSEKYGHYGFQAGYNDKAFGANSFYTPKYPNQFEQTKTTFANIQFSGGSEHVRIHPKIYWRRNTDRFELFRSDPAEWYSGHNYHKTDVLGADLNTNYYSDYGISSIGVDYRAENILSNVLGKELDEPIDVSGEPGIQYTKSDKRENWSFFAEHALDYNGLALSTGILGYTSSDFSGSFYPGIDLSYAFNGNISVFGSYNKSLRLPTFTELYYSGPTNIGNPDLAPEEAVSFELGAKYSNEDHSIVLSLFRKNAKNVIDWVKLDESSKWETKNLTHIITNGIEISWRYIANLHISGNLFFMKTDLSLSAMDLEKNSGNYLSFYALDFLKNKLSIGATFSYSKDLSLHLKYSYQQRNGSYFNWESQTEEAYKAVGLFDARIAYDYEKLDIYLDANNIFNVQYNDIANVIMPGRWLRLGISYDIQF